MDGKRRTDKVKSPSWGWNEEQDAERSLDEVEIEGLNCLQSSPYHSLLNSPFIPIHLCKCENPIIEHIQWEVKENNNPSGGWTPFLSKTLILKRRDSCSTRCDSTKNSLFLLLTDVHQTVTIWWFCSLHLQSVLIMV